MVILQHMLSASVLQSVGGGFAGGPSVGSVLAWVVLAAAVGVGLGMLRRSTGGGRRLPAARPASGGADGRGGGIPRIDPLHQEAA
jgi:hypothetical protein